MTAMKNVLVGGAITICMLVGCGSKEYEPKQEVKQEVEPKVEEP
jgi:hypothetical protein